MLRTGRDRSGVFLGESEVRGGAAAGEGTWAFLDGERFFKIANYDAMPPFFLSVVSGYDHWLFVSSTGGLTCGRRDAENALFPYGTDDKIHDAWATTGPKTVLLATRGDRTFLWEPFSIGATVHRLERNLYKNVPGNKLVFEEINHDLGLAFRYQWTTGRRFGFIRRARLANVEASPVRIELLDGVRNLLPPGVEGSAQTELSTLVDAYKRAERVPDLCAAIYSLSSILTDRAEPNEALEATVVWGTGLDDPAILLSEDQLDAFRRGADVRSEACVKGRRGAFFVRSTVSLAGNDAVAWTLVADVEQGPARTVELLDAVRRGVSEEAIDDDVASGTARLEGLVGTADGFQRSTDDRVTARHFSNTLYNIMRGGVFPLAYRFPRADFLEFVGSRRRALRARAAETIADPGDADDGLTLGTALGRAESSGDPDLVRLVHEYLPLTFSRRHGDPSRPWNRFSIRLADGEGEAAAERPYYEGNWRDIFQNWEALAISFPEYLESFVAKFVNASTPDGHNPYRISNEGIDWETPDHGNSWSNIGYWGDHQVGYLLRLLELSRAYHPGRLAAALGRDLYVYADVPYRIRPYADLLRDPRDTVDYDDAHARVVAERVERVGADGKLATLVDGTIHRVNLLEKLLLSALVRIGNLVPGGGIWMNTQRPEWNDANNALVGHGLSMVTVCYLRRYLRVLDDLLAECDEPSFDLSDEVALLFDGVRTVLRTHVRVLDGPVDAAERKAWMDALGRVNDRFRARVYHGFSGETGRVETTDVRALLDLALRFADHSIALARRDDGLFHSYNLIRFGTDGYDVEPLDEMLEGQVAVLASGYLDAEGALDLLEALRESRLYREDQNSYMLYPDRELPSFLEKNVIPPEVVAGSETIAREIDAGRTTYVERDVHGRVHFHGTFRNAGVLRAALDADPSVAPDDAEELCRVYETVFEHRKFTGRSGSMFKYEGLGCVYWHMVSKLVLATAETIRRAARAGVDADLVSPLTARFREIRDGIGVHKRPAEYGAFPTDAYSHTPAFAGVQQPGLTGQVKEDVLTRFLELGVRVAGGEVVFDPVLLARDELSTEAATWRYRVGDCEGEVRLPPGSLAFTICGVPVVYRLAEASAVHVHGADGTSTIAGNRLGPDRSRSLFERDGRIARIVVDVPSTSLT